MGEWWACFWRQWLSLNIFSMDEIVCIWLPVVVVGAVLGLIALVQTHR